MRRIIKIATIAPPKNFEHDLFCGNADTIEESSTSTATTISGIKYMN
jgi:hypothetical protein